jgi:hypothetical protein
MWACIYVVILDFVSGHRQPAVSRNCEQKLISMIKRSGKFYKPWSASTPVVLVTEKKHVVEYSEVTCLSQQAVYADVSSPTLRT